MDDIKNKLAGTYFMISFLIFEYISTGSIITNETSLTYW